MLSKRFLDRIKGDSRGRIITWVALIAVGLVISLVLGVVGCSGSHKLNPTDPVASKQKQQNPQGESGTIGSANETGSSGRGGDSTGPGVGDEAIKGLAEQMVESGGGQGGRIFRGDVFAAVFDAETHQPILDAVVCLGDDCELEGTTSSEGYAELSYPVDVIGGENIPELYITAGAEGYELLSYSCVTNEVVVFLLNPLNPAPETATIEGTFTFPDDNFLANVYATNVIDYTDNVLQPSDPGDKDDTFTLTVRAGAPVFFSCLQRDPDTSRILKVYSQVLRPLLPGGTETISETLQDAYAPGEILDLIDNKWIDYSPSREYVVDVLTPPTCSDMVSSINIYQKLYNSKFGLLPMDDVVECIEGPSGALTSYRTTYQPKLVKILSFEYLTLWLDVRYENGSGTYVMFDSGFVLNGLNSYVLSAPPSIQKPLDNDLGVGVNPEIEWDNENVSQLLGTIINLEDTENGSKWRIYMKVGELGTKLPTLSDKMEGWGLTVGNQVSIMVENQLYPSGLATSDDGAVLMINSEPKSTNYSESLSFTP